MVEAPKEEVQAAPKEEAKTEPLLRKKFKPHQRRKLRTKALKRSSSRTKGGSYRTNS